MANIEQNETTRVFRMPSSDATAPDLMKSASLVVPVLSIIKGPRPATSSSSMRPRSPSVAIPRTQSFSTT